MINQKVFYLSFHLGRQTEVDVNRTAQTHTDRQGTYELIQTFIVQISVLQSVSQDVNDADSQQRKMVQIPLNCVVCTLHVSSCVYLQ